MEILLETDAAVAVDAEAGADARREAAAELGSDPAELWPLGELAAEIPGVRLFARSEAAAAELTRALAEQPSAWEYRAVVPGAAWSDGRLEEPFRGEPARSDFRVVQTRGPLCELALDAHGGDVLQLRFHLARAGLAICGDPRWSTDPKAMGGLRLWRARLRLPDRGIDVAGAEPADFWPLGPPRAEGRPRLEVSRATVRVLRRGHPWILPDADTGDVSRLRPGDPVAVVGLKGAALGLARIDGGERVTARMWSRGTQRSEVASVEARVAKAVARRGRLLAPEPSEAVRLVHGEADALPGLFVDRIGPALRCLLTSRACLPLLDRVIDALLGHLGGALGPDPPVVRVVHLADPPPGRLRGVETVRGSLDGLLDAAGRLPVREADFRFLVDPGLGEPYRARPGTGLFLDQRANRRRVFDAARGGRWLNLFCHTGGFSVAALAGGAREVVSVDLSAPYLAWLEANLAANDLAGAPHRSLRGDARRALEQLAAAEEPFDGIVCDPPTAARAGQRFWSVRRGGGELLAACLACLRPGGALLFCRNDRGARGLLEPLLREVAADAGISLARVASAPPGRDFPQLAAFPEGDAFEGIWAIRGD